MFALLAYLFGILSAARIQDRKQDYQPPGQHLCNNESAIPARIQISFSDEDKKENRAYQEQQYALQKSLKRAAWLTFWAVFIYAAITLALWCVNKKAADAAKSAADTARDTLIYSQRPWVHPSSPIRLTQPIVIGPNRIAVSGTMTIKNYGPSPALFVVSSLDIVTDIKDFKNRADNGCNLIERLTKENEFSQNAFGPPIFPQEVMAQPFDISDDTPHPNLTVLYFAGCIIYRDQFGKSLHHTRFCVETPRLARDFRMADVLVNCNIGQAAD